MSSSRIDGTQPECSQAVMDGFFPFKLSPFQEQAISAIQSGNHCLVTAHTGSGKTVPAEFAIQHFTQLGKRVIYTSPIKALSNQKLHDFRHKFPHISFGIVTGDIEDNKEAQVLIMTTEVLSNTLLNLSIQKDNPQTAEHSAPLRFTMDFENDLAAVVFDEVHYISDAARGQAWEQSMMLLPKNVLFVMLSATIANPNTLVNWVEHITGKTVCLASTTERVVPLKHYVYMPPIADKQLKKYAKNIQENTEKYANSLVLIKEGEGQTFNQAQYADAYNVFNTVRNSMPNTPAEILPYLIKKLRSTDKLPALVFVFSRKQTEILAHKLVSSGIPSLFATDENERSKDITGTIHKEARHLLSSKLTNYQDFMDSPDYTYLMECLCKGVGYHHAGMLPILRELVEFLDEKGYVRVLFATETFAVGVNMPTRTVIFTSLTKYTESGQHYLQAHEYTQMAGRAGRRGLDTVGHCIILCPELASQHSLALVLTGRPVTIESHYKMTYHLVLRVLKESSPMTEEELISKCQEFSNSSLFAPNQTSFIEKLRGERAELEDKQAQAKERISITKTDESLIKVYRDFQAKLSSGLLKPKAAKSINRDMYKMCQENMMLERDYEIYKKYWKATDELETLERDITCAEDYACEEVRSVLYVLKQLQFVGVNESCSMLEINPSGLFALSIYEAHPLGLALYFQKHKGMCKHMKGNLDDHAKSLAQTLSLFCDIRVHDEVATLASLSGVARAEQQKAQDCYDQVYGEESIAMHGSCYISQEYTTQGLLFKFVDAWTRAETNADCQEVLCAVDETLHLSTGDFIKAILKIVKLSKELTAAAEATHNTELAAMCALVPKHLLKYLATSQSLYV